MIFVTTCERRNTILTQSTFFFYVRLDIYAQYIDTRKGFWGKKLSLDLLK